MSEVILIKSLKESQSSSLHVELDNLLKKLELQTIEEFLNEKDVEEIRNIDNEIRQIVTGTIHFPGISESERIEKVAQLIYTERSYLIKGIARADVKSILIFLSVNCYFQIEIENLLNEQESSEYFSQTVADKILKILLSIKIKAQIQPDAPYYEMKILNESEQGFANNNIKSTYNLIESIERSGRGFHFNFLFESLITFLNQLNLPCFLKALTALINPPSFVVYLQSLKKEELLQLANESSLTNKWLNFELIRQIINKENKDQIEEPDYLGIKDALAKIQITDFDFYKQTIQYFHSSNLLNASLGELLIMYTNSQIKEILTDCLVTEVSHPLLSRI